MDTKNWKERSPYTFKKRRDGSPTYDRSVAALRPCPNCDVMFKAWGLASHVKACTGANGKREYLPSLASQIKSPVEAIQQYASWFSAPCSRSTLVLDYKVTAEAIDAAVAAGQIKETGVQYHGLPTYEVVG